MNAKFPGFLFASIVALVVAASPARAQLVPLEFEMPQVVGVGLGFVPDYEGSDDYQFAAAPQFRYTFAKQERYIQLLANELSVNVLNHPNWRFGPKAAYHFGRDHNIEDSKVKRMKQIDGAIEGGAFVDYVFHMSQNPRHRALVGADILAGENGIKGGISGRYFVPIAKPVDLFVATRLNFVNSEYMDTYFGVDSKSSIRSGLKRYSADGGPKDIVFMGGAIWYLSRSWATTAGLRYARLFNEAADSPVVDKRGSANQLIGGVGVAYMW